MSRPTKLRIDLSAILQNLASVRQLAPDSNLLACVKADAYGHGMTEVAISIASKVDAFGVASMEEAVRLRESGVQKPILLLEGVFSEEELQEVSHHDLWITVHSLPQIQWLERSSFVWPTKIWLKMDSGMHRLGFSSSEYGDAYRRLVSRKSEAQIVHMTHFACADELDNDFTQTQFSEYLNTLEQNDCEGERSAANSAAVLAYDKTHLDWIRPGFMLYGGDPFSGKGSTTEDLLPAMEFTTQVIALRDIRAGEAVGYNHAWRAASDSRIAIAAVGYGDGYPRNTANGTPVLVNGQLASTVGHVAMDMMLIDVTHINEVSLGSEVELWGKNLSINSVASSSGYSPYELMTRLTGRVLRIYER